MQTSRPLESNDEIDERPECQGAVELQEQKTEDTTINIRV